MELCAGGSVVWLGIKGSFSYLYGVRLCGNQFRDADQVVGDEVQQESSGDTSPGIDRASPPLADFGRAIVLRHRRRDVDGTQVFNMALRIIGLVRACRDAMTNGLALGLRSASFRRAIGLCDDDNRRLISQLHGLERRT